MFKKAAAIATAAVMALAMFHTGCGAAEESSITMDLSNEKAVTIELRQCQR